MDPIQQSDLYHRLLKEIDWFLLDYTWWSRRNLMFSGFPVTQRSFKPMLDRLAILYHNVFRKVPHGEKSRE